MRTIIAVCLLAITRILAGAEDLRPGHEALKELQGSVPGGGEGPVLKAPQSKALEPVLSHNLHWSYAEARALWEHLGRADGPYTSLRFETIKRYKGVWLQTGWAKDGDTADTNHRQSIPKRLEWARAVEPGRVFRFQSGPAGLRVEALAITNEHQLLDTDTRVNHGEARPALIKSTTLEFETETVWGRTAHDDSYQCRTDSDLLICLRKRLSWQVKEDKATNAILRAAAMATGRESQFIEFTLFMER